MARPPASVTTASAAAILDLMVMVVSLWNGWAGVALMRIGRTGREKVQRGDLDPHAKTTRCAKSHRHDSLARSREKQRPGRLPQPCLQRSKSLLRLGLLSAALGLGGGLGGGVGLPRHDGLVGVDQAGAELGIFADRPDVLCSRLQNVAHGLGA